MRVDAIVLAAGASRRMGRNKLLLPYAGGTVLERVVRTVRGGAVASVTVVLGATSPECSAVLGGLDVGITVNPCPEGGMLSSVKWALSQASEAADAFLFALGDQPQLRSEVLASLIRAAETDARSIFVPVYGGRRGHPVLFRALHRAEILALPPTVGLNAVMHAQPAEVAEVAAASDDVLWDIDTPEDYRRALEELPSGTAG
jgi:molybdenum cofactor cytidylyltransferase